MSSSLRLQPGTLYLVIFFFFEGWLVNFKRYIGLIFCGISETGFILELNWEQIPDVFWNVGFGIRMKEVRREKEIIYSKGSLCRRYPWFWPRAWSQQYIRWKTHSRLWPITSLWYIRVPTCVGVVMLARPPTGETCTNHDYRTIQRSENLEKLKLHQHPQDESPWFPAKDYHVTAWHAICIDRQSKSFNVEGPRALKLKGAAIIPRLMRLEFFPTCLSRSLSSFSASCSWPFFSPEVLHAQLISSPTNKNYSKQRRTRCKKKKT